MFPFQCRDGKEFSPIIGFFVDAGPSEVWILITLLIPADENVSLLIFKDIFHCVKVYESKKMLIK